MQFDPLAEANRETLQLLQSPLGRAVEATHQSDPKTWQDLRFVPRWRSTSHEKDGRLAGTKKAGELFTLWLFQGLAEVLRQLTAQFAIQH